ncbi:MAG TPA: fatty acid desaturase [Thermoanaerobaculia bacterium]|nr:fatty acid desaturase [Thermoanaerobaculia bacterium]
MTSDVSPAPRAALRPSAVAGFLAVHLAALGVLAIGFSWKGVALCVASYYLRMFAITAGFHRYFSHRTYRLHRVPQFLLAFLGQTAAQKGVLWWASNHRHHHKYSDRPEDVHSPVQRGFWWSHMGWIVSDEFAESDHSRVPDLAKYPELVWLDRHEYLPTALYAVALYLAFGWVGLFYGYFLSTVLLWHGTFTINSVMHLFGRRVYATTDDSRNSFFFSLVTMGEGWHNNHHWAPGSAAQGFHWWQVDASYYLLWLGEKVGLVRGLHRRPRHFREAAHEAHRTGRAFTSVRLHERVQHLTWRWSELRQSARVTAHEAFVELEAARVNAAKRLEHLHDEAAAVGARAHRRLEELHAEIEKARAHLAEILERLVTIAESLGTPDPQPA